MSNHQISASEFVDLYKKGKLNDAKIIDVREPYEWNLYRLSKAILIPMNSIPEHLDQLSVDQEYYIVCAHGVRSWYVVNYLIKQGYSQVINVEGGMAEVQMILDTVEDE